MVIGESEGRITDHQRITRSRASVMASVRAGQKRRHLDSDRNMDITIGFGQEEKVYCCNKTFASARNMKIHQAKKCRKEETSQQRRSLDQETCGSTHQEPNHSMSHTTAGKAQVPEGVAKRKPKINEEKIVKQNGVQKAMKRQSKSGAKENHKIKKIIIMALCIGKHKIFEYAVKSSNT